ncbi:hypothetical protein EON73_00745, partial [bacterium]
MVVNYIPQMYVDCLDDAQVKYELGIRNAFKVSDNKVRRKKKLKSLLGLEAAMDTEIKYKSHLPFENDISEALVIFKIIDTEVDSDQDIALNALKAVETHVVHLIDRLKRMVSPPQSTEVTDMLKDVQKIYDRIAKRYAKLTVDVFGLLEQSVSNDPDTVESEVPPTTAPDTQPETEQFQRILEQTINSILDRRLPNLRPGTSSPRPPNDNAPNPRRGSDRFPNNEWDDDGDVTPEPHSSTHLPQNSEFDTRSDNYYTNSAANIMK